MTADCNVFIPSSAASASLMKVTGTDGQSGFSLQAHWLQIQAKTTLESHSVALPAAKSTDRTLFRRYVTPTADDFIFGPASSAAAMVACGRRIGPTTPPTPGQPRLLR